MISEEIRKKLVKDFSQYKGEDYFGLKAGAISYAMGSGKDYVFYPDNGCFGGFSARWHSNKYTFLASSLRCRYKNLYEAALDYWDYILDPEKSPFKDGIKSIEIIKNSEDRPIAFVVDDMDNLTSLFACAALQARVPQENSNKLRSYWEARKRGFSPGLALVFSETVLLDRNFETSFYDNGYSHAFYGNNVDYRKVLECNPTNQNSYKLKECATYAPLQSKWIGSKNHADMLKKLVVGTSYYKGPFKEMYKTLTKRADLSLPGSTCLPIGEALEKFKELKL